MEVYFLIVNLLWLYTLHVDALSPFGAYLKSDFEKQFHDKCDKYPFVQEHYRKIENPAPNHHINFVYHENGLRNGGLGDRIGGLVNAAAIAIRMNRTLVMRNGNHLGDFMRAFHPDDNGANPKYNYNNFSWSNYNYHNENSDRTEYDLWMCIDCTGGANAQCSIANQQDRGEPNILLRGNRAYLCYWTNALNNNREDLKRLGIGKNANLFEIAGCLLRIHWWPTDLLWEEVDKIYQQYWIEHHKLLQKVSDTSSSSSHERRSLRASSGPRHNHQQQQQQRRRQMQDSTTTQASASTAPAAAEGASLDHPDIWHGLAPHPEQFFQVGLHFRCGDQSYLQHGGFDNSCVWNPNNKNPGYVANMAKGNPTEIAQCGRALMTNLTHSLSSASSSAALSVSSPSNPSNKEEPGSTDNAPSDNKSAGGDVSNSNSDSAEWLSKEETSFFNDQIRPQFVGNEDITLPDFCSLSEYEFNQLIDTYVPLFANKGKLRRICNVYKGTTAAAGNGGSSSGGGSGRRALRERRLESESSTTESVPPAMAANFVKELMYVASDNNKASESMAKESGHPYALVSPQGCHIQLDPSAECHAFTLATWMALALSDKIVTQQLPEGEPTSSFSRYAGIYGLKDDVFRAGKDCQKSTPNDVMSHWQQSNWFC